MYIQDIIGDKDDLLTSAMAHPGLHPKRKPTIETAMKAVQSEVERRVMQNFAKQYEPLLEDVYATYTFENGEFEQVEAEARDDYGSGVDDAVEALLEPITELLSQDWLGKNTIDTRLWEKGEASKLAQSIGKEVYKTLTYNKEPLQVLSNAGIVKADVEIYFEGHMAQKDDKEKQAMADAAEQTLESVCALIKAHVGADFDVLTVFDDIADVLDSDEIISEAAGARLGIDKDGVAALQMAELEFGEETAQKIVDAINAAEGAKEKPKRNSKPKDKPAETPAGTTATATDHSGEQITATVLELLKENGGAKDTEMSAALGVSRGTYNNWINGKTPFVPSDDQRATLRDQIVKNLNGLHEALAIIDGDDAHVVF